MAAVETIDPNDVEVKAAFEWLDANKIRRRSALERKFLNEEVTSAIVLSQLGYASNEELKELLDCTLNTIYLMVREKSGRYQDIKDRLAETSNADKQKLILRRHIVELPGIRRRLAVTPKQVKKAAPKVENGTIVGNHG